MASTCLYLEQPGIGFTRLAVGDCFGGPGDSQTERAVQPTTGSSALHQRGVDPDIAELEARVGIQVFRTAYRQWL
jgi:hypothetical protein